MSKDSSATYIHMHHPRLADSFEEFTRPYASITNPQSTSPQMSSSNPTGASNVVTYGSTTQTNLSSFLPVEDIYVAPQHQPTNPEDEDDVVPDQHAAFGITRAMERRREAVWRDLGLHELVSGQGHGSGALAAASGAGGGQVGSGPGATLRGNGGGAASAASAAVRVRGAGRRMGGRRIVSLR
ncbi:hypothetical protein N7532_005623 [Penicillium argentinense]|uniref:Anaphase-promoting complex subunit 13 n=1 Tax=Penicillium argentinense TaxID=1131581 RepID=A0A9W9FEB2_9EURO|nr:uncharacterized protein N7532_005623 [Penicillium argentinense]KAJ5098622.1 hypothetical protein N7532_005623 [Penicillium argentinense]